MGTTTAIHGLRVPVGSDAPNIPADLLNLANDIDKILAVVQATAPTKKAGLLWLDTSASVKVLNITDGSAWFPVGSTRLIDSGLWTITHSAQQQVAVARSFNITFNVAPIVIVSGSMANSGGQDFVAGINPGSVTTTGCTVNSRFASNTAGSGVATVSWIAIGS